MRHVSVSVNIRGTFQQLCNAFILNCSSQSNYQSTQGAQIFLRSNTSQSEATFVRRDFVTTLVQTWLTCWLSLQPFVALHCQTEHSSVIWFDQNSGFLLQAPFHILSSPWSSAERGIGDIGGRGCYLQDLFLMTPSPATQPGTGTWVLVLHAARRASLVQSYFSDGTRCAAFRGLLIKVQFSCWNIKTKQKYPNHRQHFDCCNQLDLGGSTLHALIF